MPHDDERPVGSVTLSRLAAVSSSVAFWLLGFTLASLGRLEWTEALIASVSVALVFVPTGWWSPVGWRRRAAEASLVFPAWALVMLADPTQRRMLLPPLLAAAAWSALVAAWPRIPVHRRVPSVLLLALSARAATGLGLLGFEWWRIALALVAVVVATWAAARVGGRDLGVIVALASAVVPLQASLVGSLFVILLALTSGPFGNSPNRESAATGWVPGLVGIAFFGMTFAPWGSLGIDRVFPEFGSTAVAVLLGSLVLTRLLPPGLAGLCWFAAVMAVGPVLAPTPDRGGFVLGGELADVDLPSGMGGAYVLDIGLDGAQILEPGTAIAWFRIDGTTHRVDFPNHAIQRIGSESQNTSAVWRPQSIGREAGWRGAVRTVFSVPAGVAPHLTRHPDLDDEIVVVVETEGASLPTSPRDRAMGWWLLAAAVVVVVLQFGSGIIRRPVAVAPWTILVFGSLAARACVEPLRLLGERLGPDLALAALVTAWAPPAVVWLGRRRIVVAVAALLVPLAVATPHLTPPLYGDEPFHLAVMGSMVDDRDVDLGNNIDVEAHPGEAVFDQDGDLLHSPGLGAVLLPGYAIAGRTGALVLLALIGAAAVALTVRRARRLGVPETRLVGLALVLAVTYPVAVFATQIWVELVGAAAAAAILVAAAGGRGGRWAATVWAILATAIKTRLGLLVFPAAMAAWWGRRRGRAVGVVILLSAAAISAAVGWLTMGHPFGVYRRLHDLVPADPSLAARVVGGLAFDPSGGLLFAAPLWLIALAGTAALWRRGGPAERMLLLGCLLTAAALLHSIEWYGGGSPPARYLVPMLPAVALAGGMILREPRRWRGAIELLILPSLAVWWVLATRPHLSINPGDGGWWATDALARSYLVDTAWLLPSFLVPRTATWVVPLTAITVFGLVVGLSRWKPSLARRLGALGAALWLAGAAVLVAAIELRTDRVVELESPQVRRHGGRPHPREGTVSRFTHRRGWMVRDGEGVTVPMNLPVEAEAWLEARLFGSATRGAEIEVRWDDDDSTSIEVRGEEGSDLRLRIPPAPTAGKHRLSLRMLGRPHSAVVLDRVVVEVGE